MVARRGVGAFIQRFFVIDVCVTSLVAVCSLGIAYWVRGERILYHSASSLMDFKIVWNRSPLVLFLSSKFPSVSWLETIEDTSEMWIASGTVAPPVKSECLKKCLYRWSAFRVLAPTPIFFLHPCESAPCPFVVSILSILVWNSVKKSSISRLAYGLNLKNGGYLQVLEKSRAPLGSVLPLNLVALLV